MTQAGGFEAGSDYVAARVSFDIDNSGVSSLKELTESLNNFRTSTEAANRTGSDFLKYLQQMTALTNQANEAQTNLVNTLQRMTDTQQAVMTGQGTQVSRGFPQGRVDPLSGMGGGSGAGGANRAPTINDTSAFLGNMASQDPRQYFNMQSNWGNVRTGDVPAHSPSDNDLAQHAQRHNARDKAQNDQNVASQMSDPYSPMQRRISGMTSGAAQLLGELAPGGDAMGFAQRGMNSLSGLARASGAAIPALSEGSASVPMAGGQAGLASRGLGALAAFAGTGLGAAATGVGLLAGGNYLFQEGGQAVQNYRSMGQVRGGGLQEGLGYEMSIRSMALNPFITTEQARQIVSSGLSSGFTGKEFDTVTQFMANNLKDMNMSVAESMSLFKKNVVEGGMTQEGLAGALGGLKEGSKTGYASLPQLEANYANTSASLINAGVPGRSASQEAGAAAFTFNGISDLVDKMPQLVQSATSMGSPLGGMMLNPQMSGVKLPPGTDPYTAMESMGEGQTQATYNIIRYWAQRFVQSSGGNKGRAVTAFQQWLMEMFPDMDWRNRTMVEKFLSEVIANPNAVAQGKAKNEQAQKEAARAKPRGTGQKIGGFISGQIQTAGAFLSDLGSNIFGKTPGEEWNWDKTKIASDSAAYSQSDERSAALENLIQQYGGSGIEVGSGGKWGKLDISNEQQLKDITSGKLKLRPKDDKSAGMTLAQIGDGGKSGFGGGFGGGANNFSVAPVYGTLTVTIDQSGRATAPATVALSPSTAGANAGRGGAARNDPQPGEPGWLP